MRMLSIIATSATILAATVLAAVPVSADTGTKERFTHDGFTYVYTVKSSDDRQIITGRRYPGAEAFSLVVRGDQVRGMSAGLPVAFPVSEARGATNTAKADSTAIVQVGN